MPFVRTALRDDTSPEHAKAIVDAIHQALVSAIGMPADELFNLVTRYDPETFFFDRGFNGMARSERPVVVEITLRRGRSDAMKKTLYAEIARRLAGAASVRPADVFVFLHENDYSDWSVGYGQFAMALTQQRGPDC